MLSTTLAERLQTAIEQKMGRFANAAVVRSYGWEAVFRTLQQLTTFGGSRASISQLAERRKICPALGLAHLRVLTKLELVREAARTSRLAGRVFEVVPAPEASRPLPPAEPARDRNYMET